MELAVRQFCTAGFVSKGKRMKKMIPEQICKSFKKIVIIPNRMICQAIMLPDLMTHFSVFIITNLPFVKVQFDKTSQPEWTNVLPRLRIE
jgi:hypothetical protein